MGVGMSEWWVDLSFACGLVVIDESGVIVETMPVLHKFRGQHISRLEAWPPFRERRPLKGLCPVGHFRSLVLPPLLVLVILSGVMWWVDRV